MSSSPSQISVGRGVSNDVINERRPLLIRESLPARSSSRFVKSHARTTHRDSASLKRRTNTSLLEVLQKHLERRNRSISRRTPDVRTPSSLARVASSRNSDGVVGTDNCDVVSFASSNASVDRDMELIAMQLAEQGYDGSNRENVLSKTKVLDLIRTEVNELARPEINWRKCVLTIAVLVDRLITLVDCSNSSDSSGELIINQPINPANEGRQLPSYEKLEAKTNFFDEVKTMLGDIWISSEELTEQTQKDSKRLSTDELVAPVGLSLSASLKRSVNDCHKEDSEELVLPLKAQLGLRIAVLLGLIYCPASHLSATDLTDDPHYSECTEECAHALEAFCRTQKNHTTYVRFVLERLAESLPNATSFVPLLRRLYDCSLGLRPPWLASPQNAAAKKGTPIATPAIRVQSFAEQMPALLCAITTRSTQPSDADAELPAAAPKPANIVECLKHEAEHMGANSNSKKSMKSVVQIMSRRFPMLNAQKSVRGLDVKRPNSEKPNNTLANVRRRLHLSPQRRHSSSSSSSSFVAPLATSTMKPAHIARMVAAFPVHNSVSSPVKRSSAAVEETNEATFQTPSKKIRRNVLIATAMLSQKPFSLSPLTLAESSRNK